MLLYKGKPTFLIFWFTFCEPCLDELPSLNKPKNKFGDEVNFIAMTVEDSDQIERVLGDREFNFTHVIDARDYIDKYDIKTYPKIVIADDNAVIKKIYNRLSYKMDKNLNTTIHSYLSSVLN